MCVKYILCNIKSHTVNAVCQNNHFLLYLLDTSTQDIHSRSSPFYKFYKIPYYEVSQGTNKNRIM